MSRQHHRGPHPEDAKLFAERELPRLRAAVEEAAWLAGRGYPLPVAVTIVGNHHQLDARQRLAVQRATCSDAQRAARSSRALAPENIDGRKLAIDGFNLVITLEVALGGGLLFEGADGCLRDLAGLRGSYHMVDETDAALQHIVDTFAQLRPASATIYLDSIVSNSGRLRARLQAAPWPMPLNVELVPSADPVLSASDDVVITSDSIILDRCRPWLNLAHHIVTTRIPSARIICLGAQV